MGMLSNSHLGASVALRLEARKSFTFNVQLRDHTGKKLPCPGATFRFVAQDNKYPNGNFLSKSPSVLNAGYGFLKFDFQASELDMPEGEYPYVLVMTTKDGYSLVLMKGHIQLQGNPDTQAVNDSYDEQKAIGGIEATLRGRNVVNIQVGHVLPPGMDFFSDLEREALNKLIDEMQQMKLQLGLET